MAQHKVFFFIKSYFRDRQWDTVKAVNEYLHEKYRVITPKGTNQAGSLQIVKYHGSILGRLKSKVVSKIPLINLRKLPEESRDCEFIYTFGYIPWPLRAKYIIEFDNPYVVTFYNKSAFEIYEPILNYFFERSYKLTFMSKTALEHFSMETKEKFRNKSYVIYPFVKRFYTKRQKKINKKRIVFTFAGFDFKGKGGIELLKAFNAVKNKNIELHIFSKVPQEITENLRDERIVVYEPVPREQLINHLVTSTDVVVLPTLFESFLLVGLEALACGCGLILTNVYGTKEMVEHGRNGILLNHPILSSVNYNGYEFINNVIYRIEDFKKAFLNRNSFFESLYQELITAIERAIDEYKNWQKESIEIYEQRFSEDIWIENFKKVLS